MDEPASTYDPQLLDGLARIFAMAALDGLLAEAQRVTEATEAEAAQQRCERQAAGGGER